MRKSLRAAFTTLLPRSPIFTTAQRRALVTPVARYEFHRIDPAIFGGFTDFGTRSTFPLATPAKALFDTLLVSVVRGRRVAFLPEVTFPKSFDFKEMERWIAKIRNPRTRSAVRSKWEQLQR